MRHVQGLGVLVAAAMLSIAAQTATAAESIVVGHIAAMTGPTSVAGKPYAQGTIDAFAFINQQGGINGRKVALDTVDYGYDATVAIQTYNRWKQSAKPQAIHGWGTADTESLVDYVSKDGVVFMSGSSSGHLTDPTGRSPWTDTPAPFNFFYGPSYSDGCRALVQWAAENFKRSGAGPRASTFLGDLNRPRFVFMGDNHPFPNSPRPACIEYARDLGFEVLPPIRYALTPGDYAAQCQQLRQNHADFAFLANTADSNVALVRECAEQGVSTQFMTNIYGWDENAAKQAGDAGNGVVWVVSVAPWGSDAAGMTLLRQVSKMSDPSGEEARPAHYIRGVCSAFLMRDAMVAAAKAGGVTGANIKQGFEAMRDHVPAGLDGVCLPTTFTANDHRGTTTVMLYRSDYNYGNVAMRRVYTTTIALRPDWLGW